VEELALAKNISKKHRCKTMPMQKNFVNWNPKIAEYQKIIFCDAQTSGGLLISIPGTRRKRLLIS